MTMFDKLFYSCFILIVMMTLSTGCTQNKAVSPSLNPIPSTIFTPTITSTPSDNIGEEGGVCHSICTWYSDGSVRCSCGGSTIAGRVLFGSQDNVNGGAGYLFILNNAGSDTIAVLTYTGKKEPVFSAFIPNGQFMRLSGISGEGTYDFYYMLGDSWDGKLKKFGNVTSYKRYTDPFVFSRTFANRTYYNIENSAYLSSGVIDERISGRTKFSNETKKNMPSRMSEIISSLPNSSLKISNIGPNDFPRIVP